MPTYVVQWTDPRGDARWETVDADDYETAAAIATAGKPRISRFRVAVTKAGRGGRTRTYDVRKAS